MSAYAFIAEATEILNARYGTEDAPTHQLTPELCPTGIDLQGLVHATRCILRHLKDALDHQSDRDRELDHDITQLAHLIKTHRHQEP